MRQLTRLVRYVLPFLVQLFPGVVLLAAVGFLEAFRLVLLKPILDRVLNPASGSENILLFTIPKIDKPIYLQQFVPSHFHNAWTIVAYRVGCFDRAEGNSGLRRDLSGQPCRLRHDHQPAQRSLQLGPAALGCLLSETHDRDTDLDHHQRH